MLQSRNVGYGLQFFACVRVIIAVHRRRGTGGKLVGGASLFLRYKITMRGRKPV